MLELIFRRGARDGRENAKNIGCSGERSQHSNWLSRYADDATAANETTPQLQILFRCPSNHLFEACGTEKGHLVKSHEYRLSGRVIVTDSKRLQATLD